MARTPAVFTGTPVPVALDRAPEPPEDVRQQMIALQVSLEGSLGDRVPHVVHFLASRSREGTSTLATEFAATVARHTRGRTLLVDANARRPALVADDGRASSRGVDSPLHVLPVPEAHRASGTYPPAALREAIECLGPAYEWIVIDGPPALEVAEAAVLAAQSDGVVVVVEAGRTKRPVLTKSVDLLRKAGARVLGTVLNRRRLEIPGFIYRHL